MHLLSVKVTNPKNITHYPYLSPLFQKGFFITFAPITILIGENGVGKSTFLESLAYAIGFPTFGGDLNDYHYYNDINRVIEHDNYGDPRQTLYDSLNLQQNRNAQIDDINLSNNLKLTWRIRLRKGVFIRAETFGLLINIKRYRAITFSHGEGIVDILNRIEDDGIYILDEPESGLSPNKIMEMMLLMKKKVSAYNCQFILSTHNPILMCVPDAKLLEMKTDTIIETTPENTDHFIITKAFLCNKDKMLQNLYYN